MSRFSRSSLERNPPVVLARCSDFGNSVSRGRCSASSVGGADVERSIRKPTSDVSSRVSGIVLSMVPTPLVPPIGLFERGWGVLRITGKA